MKLRPIYTLIILLAALATLGSAAARTPEPGGLTLTSDGQGVQIQWSLGAASLESSQPPAPQLIALRLPDGADPTPQVAAASQPWGGPLPAPAPLPTRTLLDGSVLPPLPGFGPPPAPDAPLALLREGRMRGQRIVVYALSPVYRSPDGAALLTRLSAHIPQATALSTADAWPEQAPARLLGAVPGPDPIAARSAWKIRVEQAGIQSVSAATLQAAGLSLTGIDPARLRLWRQGVIVPLELRTSGATLSELRFYAPTSGDRYNSADTYWLTVESAGQPPMKTYTSITPSTCQSTALARGVWRASTTYVPQQPGPDGDHFFAADLVTAPAPASPESTTADLSSTLPRASGSVTLTVAGGSLLASAHTISVTLAGATQTSSWAGVGGFSRTLSFAAGADQAGVALMPRADVDRIYIDSVAWEAPVQLSFGDKGATFVGPAGQPCLTLSGLPAGATLYDVSDPADPIRLTGWAGSFAVDAASAAKERDYILAGPGTLRTPPVAAHSPVNLAAPLNAQAIYVAPDAFIPSLAPLVARRQAQGYSVAVVRAQDIYDSWGGGQASPQAIRAFLRYAADTWATAPIAVTLVGDGTHDPRNYLGYGQTSWIPPYLAPVDPWLSETACESCFVQLDGDDPLSDRLPDLMLGRLPVKSAAELGQLIQKISAYESQAGPGPWAGRAVYLTDDDEISNEFTYVADQSAARLPGGVKLTRVYYDPDPATPADEYWRVRDSYEAFERTMSALNSGAAVVSFLGHGHTYQWAYTDRPLNPDVPDDRPYLLNVDFAGDLTNGARLPVVLSLTCLTGQFQLPSVRGTTVDEALLLNPQGGAIATWSSAGTGVLIGHDALQRGFLNALWGAPAESPARLGDMALAGYKELFASSGDGQEELRVYGLFGDPLTRIRVQKDVHDLLLPIVQR